MRQPHFAEQARQRARAQAAAVGASEKLADASVLAAMLGVGATTTGNLIDLAVGDTNLFNSGELGINYLLGAGPGLGYLAGDAIGGALNRGEAGMAEAKTKVSAKDMKEELKRVMREEGETAAKQRFADMKNAGVGGAEKKILGSRMDRRFAGRILGSLLGTGTSLAMMVDDSY